MGPFSLTLLTLSRGWAGLELVLQVALLSFPWLVGLYYLLTARIVEAPDAQTAEARARYDFAIVLAIPLVPTMILMALAPRQVVSFWRAVGGALTYWPVIALLSWALLAVWVAWLAREGQRS